MARRPNRSELSLSKAAVSDIERLVTLTADLPRILEASTKTTPTSHVSGVIDQLASAVDLPSNELKQVFTSIENLRHISEDIGSANEAVDLVASSLGDPLGARLLEAKNQLVDAITCYSGDNPVSLSFKTQRLTYAREHLYSDADIITDARPIFSQDGGSVIKFVITHSLVISSFTNNRSERVQFSLDNADVVQLRKACDRAILKSRTLQDSLGKVGSAEVINDEADI